MIASQALISGAFSLTRQAMLLGYLPRVTIKHTAYHTEGQIYIPEVNNLLAVGCLVLVLTFRESVKLAAAYGIAVTGTMAITSILYYIVARHTWGWSRWKAGALLALFLSFDIPFLLANLFKFFDGGYVPMLIGAALIAGMLIWSRGRTALMEQIRQPVLDARSGQPVDRRAGSARGFPARAVFLAPSADHVPPILVHHVERSRSLHETVVLLTVQEMPTSRWCRPSPAISSPSWATASTGSSSPSATWRTRCLLPVLRAVSQRRAVRLRPRQRDVLHRARDDRGERRGEPSTASPKRSSPTLTATPSMRRDATACR